MKISRSIKVTALAATAALIAMTPAMAAGVTITGAGSSFAAPLIGACKTAWQNATGNTATYGSGGSGTGRSNADKGVGDYNFSDATYTPAKSTILHIPVIAAPIAVSYNLNSTKTLYLSPKTISGIFAGTITMWNDPAISADNNGSTKQIIFKKDAKGNVVKDAAGKPVVLNTRTISRLFTLPNKPITVIYRADSSGTTQNFVNMLIKKFPTEWTKASSGVFATAFPGDINSASNLGRFQSASGSEGVSALAEKTKYSITYVESSYATAHKLGKAAIKNAAGNYALPDAGGTASFLSAATVAADGKLTFDYETTEAAAYIYGIVTYALVDSAATGENAKATKSLITYILDAKCPTTDPSLEYTTVTGKLLDADKVLIAKLNG
jgi:phosphate transport system substrate-binding protein